MDNLHEEWVRLAQSGIKGKTIARRYGVSKYKVYKALAIRGVHLPASGGRRSIPVADRFAALIAKLPNGCWQWQGNRNHHGYGRVTDDTGTVWLAHRLSYRLHKGEYDLSLKVCHTCDNTSCVNPEHLFLGDMAANTHDMIAKGRHAHGVRVPQSKLTEDQVRSIRALHAAGGYRHVDLAEMFGITRRAVGRILTRQAWAHVE